MLRTLGLLMRASSSEAEDRLIEANGSRLLAQHLRDADADIKRGRHALADLVARQKAEIRRVTSCAEEITRREQEGQAAVAADDAELAGDIANHIMTLEDQRARAEAAGQDLEGRISELRETLSDAERRLAGLAADLRAARSSELWRRARNQLGNTPGASPLEEAEALSGRIRETSQYMNDRIAALSERPMSAGEDLDQRLSEAGLNRAEEARRKAVLARFAPKSQATQEGDDQ